MKFIKLLSILFIGSFFFLTSCDPDNLDEKEVTIEIPVIPENNLISALVTTPTGGLDLGCITINYPFDLITEGENIITITSIEEFEAALLDTSDWIVDFVYPLEVTNDDDEVLTVDDIEELGELFASCIPDEGWGGDEFPAFLLDDSDCYTHVYPFDLVDLDDNTITVNNQEEFIDALASNDILFFVFPISIEDEDGEVESIENSEELFEALTSCYDGESTECDSLSWGGVLVCYDIVFPAVLIDSEGNEVTVENVDELNELFFEGDIIGFGYPLSLENEDDEIIVVNSDEELEEAFEACFDFDFELASLVLSTLDAECYELNFPLEMIGVDGDTLEINNEEEFAEAFFNGATLEPGFTVTDNDGEEHEIEDIEDLFEILEEC